MMKFNKWLGRQNFIVVLFVFFTFVTFMFVVPITGILFALTGMIK